MSDDDLVRRGDAIEALCGRMDREEYGHAKAAVALDIEAIRSIPAVPSPAGQVAAWKEPWNRAERVARALVMRDAAERDRLPLGPGMAMAQGQTWTPHPEAEARAKRCQEAEAELAAAMTDWRELPYTPRTAEQLPCRATAEMLVAAVDVACVAGSTVEDVVNAALRAAPSVPAVPPSAAERLTFDALRRANLARMPEFRDRKGRICHVQVEGQPVGFDWALSQWSNAACGELGEAANLIKKIERGDMTLEEGREELGNEIADGVVYLDILAHRAGVKLDEAIIRKFNVISERVGSSVRLAPSGAVTAAAAPTAVAPNDAGPCPSCGGSKRVPVPCPSGGIGFIGGALVACAALHQKPCPKCAAPPAAEPARPRDSFPPLVAKTEDGKPRCQVAILGTRQQCRRDESHDGYGGLVSHHFDAPPAGQVCPVCAPESSSGSTCECPPPAAEPAPRTTTTGAIVSALSQAGLAQFRHGACCPPDPEPEEPAKPEPCWYCSYAGDVVMKFCGRPDCAAKAKPEPAPSPALAALESVIARSHKPERFDAKPEPARHEHREDTLTTVGDRHGAPCGQCKRGAVNVSDGKCRLCGSQEQTPRPECRPDGAS